MIKDVYTPDRHPTLCSKWCKEPPAINLTVVELKQSWGCGSGLFMFTVFKPTKTGNMICASDVTHLSVFASNNSDAWFLP